MKVVDGAQKTEWRVILADDDDDYAVVIEQALRQVSGVPMEIRRARTGDEALALLKEFVPDLLLLDLKMPGMAGHDALEAMKADDALRSVPVAVLSSSDRDDDVAKSYLLGGNHYITKPGTPRELEVKLAALLRNLRELRGIRRGSTGGQTTATSAVHRGSRASTTWLRWAAVVGVLMALYLFGKLSGAF